METTIEPVVQVRDWVIQKIKDTDDYDTAIALVAEFEEWLDLEGKDEIDIFVFRMMTWVIKNLMFGKPILDKT